MARVGSLGGHDFLPQADGTLRCRQGATLYPQERRREHEETVRVVYAARIADCRCCPIRTQCQGHGISTKKPRRVSAVLSPLPESIPEEPLPSRLCVPSSHPVLWGDWSRTQPRRAWIEWHRSHLITVEVAPAAPPSSSASAIFSRAQRAHWRMTQHQRLARNRRLSGAPSIEITVYGISTAFAQALGVRIL